ncbi:MFS transporter [Leucobacter sp. UCMA 4100]|uniref:MFS transporter n=1 Tax=Leucobacter sp. UCMA 4100 TaxID=2810534 RepID=UPI0022EAE36F|nr:MFS transporter [Leucobacter sp. UCMA 4100]MDA3147322.1 MFS transporter [Leucobacter sp. UCMA 4100]
MTTASQPSAAELKRWLWALFTMFALLGATWGTLLTRFPTLRDELGFSFSMMSIIVLCPSLGTIVGLSFAGRLETKLGARKLTMLGLTIMALALPLGSWLLLSHVDPLSYFVLGFVGVGFGFADVAVNVSGAQAERASGRPRMSTLHAGFSIGGITSVLLGAWAESIKLDVVVHHVSAAIIVIAAMLFLQRFIVETAEPGEIPVTTGPISTEALTHLSKVWKDPRVLLLGFIALAGSLADGVATDWMPLAFIDIYSLGNSHAVLVLTLMYVGALTLRLSGDYLVTRFGRVSALRFSFGCAIIGVLLVSLSPWAWLAIPGALLWGMGDALAFPLAVSAASDHPKLAARRVAAVSTIAYTAYAAGPVTFGFMGDHFGFRIAFLVLAAILVAAWIASPKTGGAPHTAAQNS